MPAKSPAQDAERVEQTVDSHVHESTDPVVQAELQTLENLLRKPLPPNSLSDDPECQRVVALIERIGKPAEDESPSRLRDHMQEQLGHYQLLEKLGEGGMGAVYKALHGKLEKLVALKVLPAGRLKNEQAVARFEREMRAVGRLNHPNIVAAHDAGEIDGHHYLVMELVDGVDLSVLVRRCGPLPVAEACEVIRQAALGLDHAYAFGMVHRDIKPGNLMLTRDGQVKVLDMGLALLDEMRGGGGAVVELTTSGQMMGTLDYMAPEQGTDSHQVDIRADVYSLGATLFKLISGQPPFFGPKYDSPISKLMALATEPPRVLAEVREDVPAELSALVARMLSKQVDERPATPREVVELLAPFVAGARLDEVARLATERDVPTGDDPGAGFQVGQQMRGDAGAGRAVGPQAGRGGFPMGGAMPSGRGGGKPANAGRPGR
jgi:serine/threonine protein kinase